ncbi:MAG: PHP domain-containing protein [Chloroflexi bacterium]|nr:PHP domain-containing protein [Chloroflexota bacterium]
MSGGQVDLHVHTSASDGQLSPAEVVHEALALGLTTIAITDHDTTEGIEEALEAAKGTGLDVIPGVEISAEMPRCEVHILGYYIAYRDPALCRKLALFRELRLKRAQKIMAKLAQMGMPLDWDRIQQLAGTGTIGRPHIARAMLEKGYISSIDEAFDLYISRGGPAYVKRPKLTPVEAIQAILAAQGLPVLAHPLQINHLVPELAAHGLVGLEVYYPGYTPDEIDFLLSLANKYGLLVTGGTDFHGEYTQCATRLGEVMVPQSVVETLRARYERQKHNQN